MKNYEYDRIMKKGIMKNYDYEEIMKKGIMKNYEYDGIMNQQDRTGGSSINLKYFCTQS